MNKNIFNPTDWLETPKIEVPKKTIPKTAATVNTVVANDIESHISAIEQQSIDITCGYANWRDVGFAFAEEYGETGRDYFHRISKYNSTYNAKECDEQFNKCLNAKGTGITIATFYYAAKQAGITSQQTDNKKEVLETTIENKTETKKLPTIPSKIIDKLPQFLQQALEPTSTPEERDIMLLGTLTTISACFPKLFGIYDGKKVFSNLYLFVTAPASSGKGRLTQCKNLVLPIHKEMREQAGDLKKQFEIENAAYNMSKNKNPDSEKPTKPPERMLFIPANNSTTGVFQLLSDNQGKGLIFETEGDTLAQAFKSDYGNYSDGFRKAFHHETISYYRRTDREYVDIENPCLSTVLSGTPKQISALIPNAEKLPTLASFAGYNMQRPITTTNPIIDMYSNNWQVGLSLTYNIESLYKTPKKETLDKLKIAQVQELKTLTQQNLQVATKAAYLKYNEAISQRETYLESKRLADENYKIIEKKYLNQLALITDMLDASNAKLDAELQYINAEINIVYAYYNILKTTGKL